MNPGSRVVLDTSTLIGAMLRPRSVPGQVFLTAMGTGTLCVSPATLAELEAVLAREKFDAYLDRERRSQFLERYRQRTVLFAVTETDELNLARPCRDPRDNKFLALAQHCAADLIVSSDSDLLVLNPWQGIQILTPAQFLG